MKGVKHGFILLILELVVFTHFSSLACYDEVKSLHQSNEADSVLSIMSAEMKFRMRALGEKKNLPSSDTLG